MRRILATGALSLSQLVSSEVCETRTEEEGIAALTSLKSFAPIVVSMENGGGQCLKVRKLNIKAIRLTTINTFEERR